MGGLLFSELEEALLRKIAAMPLTAEGAPAYAAAVEAFMRPRPNRSKMTVDAKLLSLRCRPLTYEERIALRNARRSAAAGRR